jgi:hypothetical protein
MNSITTTWTTEDVLLASGGGITTEQADYIMREDGDLAYDIREGCIAERIRELIVDYIQQQKREAMQGARSINPNLIDIDFIRQQGGSK